MTYLLSLVFLRGRGFFAATGWFCGGGGGCGAAWGWPLKSLWPRVHILQQRSLWPTVTPPRRHCGARPCWLLVYIVVQALHHRTTRCRRSKVGYKTKAFVLPSTTTATSKTKVCSCTVKGQVILECLFLIFQKTNEKVDKFLPQNIKSGQIIK